MSVLFSPFRLRDLEFQNRIFMAPMCQYAAEDGTAKDWHAIHYATRAIGGVGLVIIEATAVVQEGRITPWDLGLWSDRQVGALAVVADLIRTHGAVAGIQLAHSGRKGSCETPWQESRPLALSQGGWETYAPSSIPFDLHYPASREMTLKEIDALIERFQMAAQRALRAGFQVVELHMAHGYLMHQFLSPLSNQRRDQYGGSWENRVRFPVRVAEAVRKVWPPRWPVFVRISSTDWVDGGWDLEQSIRLARVLLDRGIDFIDCSSGGLTPLTGIPGLVERTVIPTGPGYQVPFASSIRNETGIATGAVGYIMEPLQAEQIVAAQLADAVLLGRALLRYPYWSLYAAQKLGVEVTWPNQYQSGKL